MFDFLNTPFFWGLLTGLGLGLIATIWTWIVSVLRRSEQRKEMGGRLQSVTDEVEKLRQHLHTQMQITAKGTEEQQKQLVEFKTQNENLRVMVQNLQQKPDNTKLRALEVWQRAVERMNTRAPGFAGAWQQAVAEADTEIAEAEGGLTRFVRKFLGGGKATTGPVPATGSGSTAAPVSTTGPESTTALPDATPRESSDA